MNHPEIPSYNGKPVETHPLEPFLPDDSKILVCGTFPPQRKRWSMDFYYPNFINDFWRIMGIIYFDDRNALVDVTRKTFRLERIKELLSRAGIAMSDTGKEIVRTRDNASDKYLEILRPIDLRNTLEQLPECRAVVTTGEKAAGIIAARTGSKVPATGLYVAIENPVPGARNKTLYHWRMPSTSRAYPLPIEKKAEAYKKMLIASGIFPLPNLRNNDT